MANLDARPMAAIALLCVVLAPHPGFAQKAPPPADPVDVLSQYLLKQKLIELPNSAPNAKQVAAPSGANGTTTVVAGPSFPELIGLAFDNNMAGLKDGVFTIDLNVFAFRAMADPNVDIDQTRYATSGNSALRRIGVAVSVGGKGEKFDRTGDDQADDPLPANSLTDVVTSEVRVRVFGSRDRRDKDNFRKFTTDAAADYQTLATLMQAFAVNHLTELPHTKPGANGDTFLDVEKFNDFLARPELQAELKTLGDAYQAFITKHGDAVTTIDQQAVWTVVGGGTHHKAAFGPNRLYAGLRGVKSTGPWDHTLNIDWRRANAFMGRPVATAYAAGYEASRLIFKGGLSDDGVTLSFAVNGEFNQHVPEATHTRILRASLGFAVPMSPTLSVPITLSYANHADLLTADHTWAGQIGLSWDLSGHGKR